MNHASRPPAVGFDRFIRRAWADRAAEIALTRPPVREARDALDLALQTEVPSATGRSKTAGILVALWIAPPRHLRGLRDRALELSATGRDTLPLHWGLALARYPFFGAVVDAAGSLFALRDAARQTQISRRVTAHFGDRSTVHRAVQRVLQTAADWGALEREDAARDLAVRPASRVVLSDEALAGWLAEAALHGTEADAVTVHRLLTGPALFPFLVDVSDDRVLHHAPALSAVRHGVGDWVASLR